VPTLIAGIYGMNFFFMPELELEYGYPAVLLAMGLIVLALAWFMRRKGWF
jgi:magnesium transporter